MAIQPSCKTECGFCSRDVIADRRESDLSNLTAFLWFPLRIDLWRPAWTLRDSFDRCTGCNCGGLSRESTRDRNHASVSATLSRCTDWINKLVGLFIDVGDSALCRLHANDRQRHRKPVSTSRDRYSLAVVLVGHRFEV